MNVLAIEFVVVAVMALNLDSCVSNFEFFLANLGGEFEGL